MKTHKDIIASTESACPENTTELFFVVHPKALKPLLGPFLNAADAECGRIVVRCPGATVEVRAFTHVEDTTCGHATNNGQVCRTFAEFSYE